MDEEFREFFEEFDEDLGLKVLFDQSRAEATTQLVEISTTIGEIVAEGLEMEEEKEEPEAWMRIAIM